MILWGTVKLLLKKCGIQGPGISVVMALIPGWKFVSGEGLGFDLMEKIGLGRFSKPKEPPIYPSPTDKSDDEAVAKNIKSLDNKLSEETPSGWRRDRSIGILNE